ncbi:MAG TPA: AAC(3) family N-acetyltransferase [Armatimonadetes bacterium]|nr:AAC(3) family N-acetyltransferase [Armatimonadota bacterium]
MAKVVVTREDIVRVLRDLGVRRGMGLMVHSSLSAFGWVEGGAETVIAALMEAVGPEGTLLLPSFNHGAAFRPDGPGYYDPRQTPTTNGRIPDTFWRLSGVYRSLNPTHPFAAWGKNALRYLENHHLTLTLGEDSPLGLLAREGGYQLNLGTTHHTSTAKHVAEIMRRVPCLGLRTEEYPVRLPDGRRVKHRTWSWRERACPLTDSGEFIDREMERRGWQRKGKIGQATVTFFRLWDFLEVVWFLLENGYEGHLPCSRCPIRPRRTSTSVKSDWIEEQKRAVAAGAAPREVVAETQAAFQP